MAQDWLTPRRCIIILLFKTCSSPHQPWKCSDLISKMAPFLRGHALDYFSCHEIDFICTVWICAGLCWFVNSPPNREEKERWEREADHSRWVSDRCNKEGNLRMRLVWSRTRSLHPPAGILKVHTEALTRFSQVFSPGGLNSTFISQGRVFGNSSHCGNDAQSVHPKTQGWVRGLLLPGSSSRIKSNHVLGITFSNRCVTCYDQYNETLVTLRKF